MAIGIVSHSELVLTRCCVRGLFRNGQGAAELAFGSDTAAHFLPILSSPLVLTQQIVRTQFRMALDVALFYRGSFVIILGRCLGTLKCARTGVNVYDDLEMW